MFCWFWDESWEVFFRALVAEVVGATWGHFSRHVAQSWKAENYGFVNNKHYFSEFWGAGLRRFPQLFSSCFLRRVWRRYFTIFWKFEGPAVPPKTTVGEHFRYKCCIDFASVSNGKLDPKFGKTWRCSEVLFLLFFLMPRKWFFAWIGSIGQLRTWK